MEKIRVLFVLGSLQVGGSERQVIETLKVLDRSRFEPQLYAVYRDGPLFDELPGDVPLASYWHQRSPPKIYLPGRIRRRQAHDLARLLASERIDAIYDRNYEMTLLAAAACRIRPTPRISVVSADPERDLSENGGRFWRLKRRWLIRDYREAHRVIAVSRGLAQAVTHYYRVPPRLVVTIPSFFEPDDVARRSQSFQPPMEPDRFHLVTVGRLQPQKGHTFLIEAMEDLVHRRGLSQLKLWIIGHGPLHRDLANALRRHRLEQHVCLAGYQPNPIPYIRAAQLFCLPSLYEGMPNVLQEAVFCEVPVLACDCPHGPAEILDGGRYGRLVPPADATALADAIADAVAHYSQWRSRTAAARVYLEQHYSRRAAVALLEELLEAVLTESTPCAE